VRFQNNIQSLFQRVRLLYGATPLEDIINYNVIVRALTEWSATNQNDSMDQTSIAEGIGGYLTGFAESAGAPIPGLVNVRQNYIQGIDGSFNAPNVAFQIGNGAGIVPNTFAPAGIIPTSAERCTRRYQINFALGLFTQDKLVIVQTITVDSNQIHGVTIGDRNNIS